MQLRTAIITIFGCALIVFQTGFSDQANADHNLQDDAKQTQQQEQEAKAGDKKTPDDPNQPRIDATPDGFVLQKLDPIGGRIFKPSDWKFDGQVQGKTLIYKLFEPLKDGRKGFDTGLTINMVLNAAEATKMKPSAYAQKYLDKLKLSGQNPVRLKKETYNKTWVRDGIIVTERKNLTGKPKDYRIVYEFHAEDKTELLIVLIFGATADEFKDYYPIYKTMTSGFVMADMKAAKLPQQGQKKPGKKTPDNSEKDQKKKSSLCFVKTKDQGVWGQPKNNRVAAVE